MSDSELDAGAVLVQIAVAFSPEERFSSLLGWADGSYHSTERAMNVHGFTPAQIAAAPTPAAVDEGLHWFLARGLAARGLGVDAKRLVPVGFNVGAFDLPFVKRYLPLSYGMLSRRVVDLNSFCFGYAEAGIEFEGSTPSWSGWKRIAQRYAVEDLARVGIDERWHDAEYDAVAALSMMKFFTSVQRGEP